MEPLYVPALRAAGETDTEGVDGAVPDASDRLNQESLAVAVQESAAIGVHDYGRMEMLLAAGHRASGQFKAAHKAAANISKATAEPKLPDRPFAVIVRTLRNPVCLR